ncbi:MAG: hypothetical protein INF48_08675 [Rhodobacter sp.]|nr:hypothetical protein [Rhodobacter sp.]
MKGFAIFRHSVRQLAGNIGPALRISAVLTVILQMLGYLLDVQGDMARYGIMLGTFGSGVFPWKSVLPYFAFSLLSGCWIGVGWCRYVLMEEQPGTILPLFRPSRILAYLVALLVLILASVGAGFLLGFLTGFVLGFLKALNVIGETASTVLFVVLVLPVSIVLALRFSLILPAAAIGEKPSMTASWRATRGQGPAILVATVLVFLVIVLVALPAGFVFQPFSAPAWIWQGVIGWVTLMLGLSLSATLYGHYVQGRPLV